MAGDYRLLDHGRDETICQRRRDGTPCFVLRQFVHSWSTMLWAGTVRYERLRYQASLACGVGRQGRRWVLTP